jgi:hypothetical protein
MRTPMTRPQTRSTARPFRRMRRPTTRGAPMEFAARLREGSTAQANDDSRASSACVDRARNGAVDR